MSPLNLLTLSSRILRFRGKTLSAIFLSILLIIPYFSSYGFKALLEASASRDSGIGSSVGERYVLVFYDRLSPYMAKSILDRGYRIKIAILDLSGAPSPPKVFKDNGIISLGYLNILGVPSYLIDWVMKNHPEWLLYTASGKPARYWYGQSLMCNLAVDSFKEYLIDEARSIVESGYDGVLLDDVVINPSWLGGPLYDRPVYNESKHGPWISHLVELFRRIKSETGALVVYNAGWSPPNELLMDVADGVMLESHPGSWSGNYRSPNYYLRDWTVIYNNSIIAQRYAERGKMVIALNYGGDERTAFYTYAAARLFDFYYWYSIPALNHISESKVLKLDLGQPLDKHHEVNGVYYRVYSNGIVVVNPTGRSLQVSIRVSAGLGRLIDIRTMKMYEARNGDLVLEVGSKEGCVLLREEIVEKETLNHLLLYLLIIIAVVAVGFSMVLLRRRIALCRRA